MIFYIKSKTIFTKPNNPNNGYRNLTKLEKPKIETKIEQVQIIKFMKDLFFKSILSKKQCPEDIAVVKIAEKITILYKTWQNSLIIEDRYNKGNSKSE